MNEKEAKKWVDDLISAEYACSKSSGGRLDFEILRSRREEIAQRIIRELTSADAKPETTRVMTPDELTIQMNILDAMTSSAGAAMSARLCIRGSHERLRELLRIIWANTIVSHVAPELRIEIEQIIQELD